MKKIIHFQIPLNEYGTPAIPLDTFRAFMKYVSDVIGDEYYVIATPLIPENKKDIIHWILLGLFLKYYPLDNVHI